MACVLPRELVEEVLVRLPAEEVYRLRWVSKSWKTSIESPEFIKLHLRRSSARSLISNVFAGYDSDSLRKISVMDCLEESPNRMKATAKLYSMVFKEGWSEYDYLCVKGCCNGLICVSREQLDLKLPQEVVLWNPCTHQILQLPAVIEDADITSKYAKHSYGLGYDEGHDEYKVVRLVKFSDQWTCLYMDFRVYSLRWNSWRKLLEFPYQNFSFEWCVLANGALHWWVTKSNVIVAFNLTTEKYRVFDFYNIDPDCQLLHFGVLDDCLCLSVSIPMENIRHDTDAFPDFWIMKEYGVKDSWTKLVIKRPPPYPGIKLYGWDWRPVSLCNKKYTLLQRDRYLTRYDTENKLYDDQVVVLDDVSVGERMRGRFVFVPSLELLLVKPQSLLHGNPELNVQDFAHCFQVVYSPGRSKDLHKSQFVLISFHIAS